MAQCMFGKRCWALQLRLYDIPTQSEYLSCNQQPQGWMPQKFWIFQDIAWIPVTKTEQHRKWLFQLCSVEQMVLQMQHTVPKCAMFRSWIEFKHPGDDLVSWHILAQRVTTLPQMPQMPQWTEVGDNWLEYVDITVAGMPLRPKSLWRTNPSS